MSGFTKLVPEIIHSSLWNESSDIRIVWITMLAVKDENGYVQGDSRTLSRLANVSREAASEALELFQQQDEGSKTPDNGGRRICKAPGGWIVLNHHVYRASDDVQREKTRDRVRRFREKHDDDVTVCNVTDTLLSASASASASVSASEEEEGMQGGKKPVTTSYGEFQGVKLTDEEHVKLTAKQGADRLAKGIEILDDYMRAKGKRYKDHYAVLKETSWVWEKVDKAEGVSSERKQKSWLPQGTGGL